MSPEAIGQTAQSVTDIIVGKLLDRGLAKLANSVLSSTIDIKGGKMRFNGKDVAFPAPAATQHGDGKPADDAAAAADND